MNSGGYEGGECPLAFRRLVLHGFGWRRHQDEPRDRVAVYALS